MMGTKSTCCGRDGARPSRKCAVGGIFGRAARRGGHVPALALLCAACALPAVAAIPSLSGVAFSQEKASHRVTVTYTLSDAPAVITFDFLTNGVSVVAQFLTNVVGSVNRYVPVGTHTIEWDPVKAGLPETIKLSATAGRAVVTAWPKDAPPDYMVLDLRPGVTDRVAYYASAEAVPFTVTNIQYKTDKLVLRRIHAAYKAFRMGTSAASREVMLTKDYYMAIYPLTQGQYWRVKGGSEPSKKANPASCTYGTLRGGSWPDEDAVGSGTVAAALNDLVGAEAAFDITTEAQWEFAARDGRDALWPFVTESTTAQKLPFTTYGWNINNANSVLQDVGLLRPTGCGLYDLFGLNNEWCRDYFSGVAKLLSLGTSVVDPRGVGASDANVVDGNIWRVYRSTASVSQNIQDSCADRGGQRTGLAKGGRFVCEARAFGGDVSAEEDAASLPPNRVVTVTYDLPEDRIVTFTARENGVELPPEALTRTWGDVNKLVEAGNGRSFALYPDEDYLGRVVNAANVTVELTFWEKSSPPDYMVVNACITNCVHYYASTNWLPGGLVAPNRYRISDIAFRRIPAKGVVWRMGSDATTDGSNRVAANETPHYVKLTNDFYMAVFLVNDYQSTMINKSEGVSAQVSSWKTPFATAESYAVKLAATSGLPVTLPTEAQWEFAARAGGGDRYGSAGSADADLAAMAHCKVTGSDHSRSIVGNLKPNAWGLYDIFGSVLEWCLDWFTAGGEFADSWNTPGWETGTPVIDPRGPATNCAMRVTRGGHYSSSAKDCRAAARHPRKLTGDTDASGSQYCGTRLVVTIPN